MIVIAIVIPEGQLPQGNGPLCPNCKRELKRGETDDLPPVYCSYCGLGWPRIYPSPAPFIYIRIRQEDEGWVARLLKS